MEFIKRGSQGLASHNKGQMKGLVSILEFIFYFCSLLTLPAKKILDIGLRDVHIKIFVHKKVPEPSEV